MSSPKRGLGRGLDALLGPERAGSTMTDRRILLLGVLVGAGFVLFIVLAVVLTILLEHR